MNKTMASRRTLDDVLYGLLVVGKFLKFINFNIYVVVKN